MKKQYKEDKQMKKDDDLDFCPYNGGYYFINEEMKNKLRSLLNGYREKLSNHTQTIKQMSERILELESVDNKRILSEELNKTKEENAWLNSEMISLRSRIQGLIQDSEQRKLEILNFRKRIDELHNLEEIEFLFKEHLVKVHFGNKVKLVEKSLDFLLDLYEEIKFVKQEQEEITPPILKKESEFKQIDNEEEDSDFPPQNILYDPSVNKCKYCDKRKLPLALQCEDCKRKINNIRVSKCLGMQEAREIYEESINFTPEK